MRTPHTGRRGGPCDSNATKAGLLDAAFTEFAAYGIAGARVDRIAETAGANKRLISVHPTEPQVFPS
ncbi:TetR family transcriptional regulator [Streptomyces sp. NEAU-YJ-81]|nr:TetR family transcriptional regulator [Streptomyces sp. NEAU-YJ-81]MBO3680199.1 TetR family transcriptional regulator [Streptomyces sp. NEAU-YJ-81]